jgi:serine/threonine protein kinase
MRLHHRHIGQILDSGRDRRSRLGHVPVAPGGQERLHGVPGGTKWFASPEQLGVTGAAPSMLSDLYSVGALAYWLLTGLAPLRRELETAVGTDADLLQVRHLMQAGTRPERADHLTPDVPEQLGRLIDQWLSYTPSDRIPRGMDPSAALGWAARPCREGWADTPALAMSAVRSRSVGQT